MQFHTNFLLSAMSADHFPSAARTGDAPEVAFLGRSNVGKSSLLNKLVGSAAAKVSSAKISKSISAEWASFIDPYLAERQQLALCICLVDSNIPPQASDTQLLTFLREIGRPHLVVATKADRLSGNTLAKSLATLRKAHGEDNILPVSSKSENGVKTLWPEILSVLS